MKDFFLILILTGLLAGASEAGTITGKVHAEGKAGGPSELTGGKYESHQFKFVERVNYADMRDFVVYLEGPVGTNLPAAVNVTNTVNTTKISQHKAAFTPHVLPIVKNTTVNWPNNDDIFHNVFSYSEAKQFDLGLYKGGESKDVLFDKPGQVEVFCSIHSSMHCIVLVLENPYFVLTDERGNYKIANVPAGAYKLKAWHERMPTQTREITVPEEGEVKADFTLGITNLPKY
jgi:plastocyanin